MSTSGCAAEFSFPNVTEERWPLKTQVHSMGVWQDVVSQEEGLTVLVAPEDPVVGLTHRYAQIASHLGEARLKRLDSGEWFVDVPGLSGPWASGPTPPACLVNFQETVFDWVMLKIEHQDKDLPVLGDIDLNVF